MGLKTISIEELMTDVRQRRDVLIAKTDWTQMPDAPLSAQKKEDFVTYRQSLREIPQVYTKPEDVVWPIKP